MLRLAVANAPRKWLDTYMKNCFTRRGGDSERRTDKPQKTVRRRVGVALKGLRLKIVRRRRKTDLIDPKNRPKVSRCYRCKSVDWLPDQGFYEDCQVPPESAQ